MINEDSGVIGEVEKPSVFGMIMNPKEQLEKIRNNPKSLMPVLIVTAVTFIGILLLYYSFTVPPELFEELSEQELQLALNVGKITLIVAGLIGPIFGITLASLIYFLVAKMIRSEVSFKQMFSMFAHLNIIGAIGSIIHGLAVLLIPGINREISITSLESIVNAGGILGAVLNVVRFFEFCNNRKRKRLKFKSLG